MIRILNILILGFLFSQQFIWDDNGVALRQGAHIEWQKTGDIGDAGEMIFAWSDTRTSDREVYAQKFNSSGEKLWGENGVIVVSYEGRQEDPILIHDGNGGAYVIWRDYRVEPDPIGDVYAQHIDSEGNISYGESGFALSDQPEYQVSLNMCSDGQGGAYAIWRDADGKTYASHLTPNSVTNPGTGTVIMDYSWGYANISLETAGGGDAMMVWFDERPEGGESQADVYAQRIGLDENENIITKWSTPEEGGIPICTADGKQEGAKVTYYNEDWNVVVWEDSRHNDLLSDMGVPSTIDIYAQFIGVDGDKAEAYYENGNPLVSNLCYDPTSCTPAFPLADQISPRVKASDRGAFVIWIDKRNVSDDIYMEIITPENPEGLFDGDSNFPFDGVAVTEAPNAQSSARLTTDGFGGAYVVWDDLQNSDFNLYVQHYNDSGTASFEEGGIFLSDADNNQISPLVRPDQYGGALAVWEDKKDGSISIYVQHIDPILGVTLQDNGMNMYYGIDGNAFFYYDADPYKSKPKSLYLNNKNLVYWVDRRGGEIYIEGTPYDASYIYGTFVDNSGPIISKQLASYDEDTKIGYDQKFPDIKNINDKFLLSFVGLYYQDAAKKVFYQMLDDNLDASDSNESILADSEENTSQGSDRSYATIIDESGYSHIIYSKNGYPTHLNEIFTMTIDPSGVIYQLPNTLYSQVNSYSDLTVKDAYSSMDDIDSDAIIIFEEQDISGNTVLNSYVQPGGLVPLSTNEGEDQQFEDATKTNNGVFVVWEENKNGNIDIFGQHIDFEGNLLGVSTGIVICDNTAEQKNPSIDYNSSLNEVMVCWDDRRNTDRDIYCASILLDSYIVNEISVTENKSGAQVNPYVKSTLTDSYLVIWEESTLSSSGSDILMQEIKSSQLAYNQDVVVCDAFHNQLKPRIDILTESGDVSYLIYWEDMRSSGKAVLTNLFSQQLKINDCSGYLGGDEGFPPGTCNCNGDTEYDECNICGGPGAIYECGCEDLLEGYDCNGNSLSIDENLPMEFKLYNNFPNPFNPITNIMFDIPKSDFIEINIYNINGQKVKDIHSGYFLPGQYNVSWNGTDNFGGLVSSGIYIYTMNATGFNKKNKMILIK